MKNSEKVSDNLGIWLEDTSYEVDISVVGNQEVKEKARVPTKEAKVQIYAADRAAFNLYEDWKILQAAELYKENNEAKQFFFSQSLWKLVVDPETGKYPLVGQRSERSVSNRYAKTLIYLKKEDTKVINDLAEKLSEQKMRRLRCKFTRGGQGDKIISKIIPIVEQDNKSEEVIDLGEQIKNRKDTVKQKRKHHSNANDTSKMQMFLNFTKEASGLEEALQDEVLQSSDIEQDVMQENDRAEKVERMINSELQKVDALKKSLLFRDLDSSSKKSSQEVERTSGNVQRSLENVQRKLELLEEDEVIITGGIKKKNKLNPETEVNLLAKSQLDDNIDGENLFG